MVLCQPCCVHLHVTITSTPLCSCTKHQNAFEEGNTRFRLPDSAVLPTITYPPHWHPPSPSTTPATQPQPGDVDEDAPSPPRARRTRGSGSHGTRGGRSGPAGRGGAIVTTASQADSPAADPACKGSNRRSQYALSFSPVYDYTLYQAQMIEQQRLDKAAMSKQVGHVQMRMIDIFWWDEDGKPARKIRVEIPNDPWFHPRDSTHLVNRFALKNGSLFQFYDWRQDTWLDGGFDSVALHVDISGELHYRSPGVTWSDDMPGSSVPLSLPHSSAPCPTPPSAISVPGTPSSRFPLPVPSSASSVPSTPSSRVIGKRPMPGPIIDLTEDDQDDNTDASITPMAPSLPSFLLHRSNVTSTPSTSRGSATPSSRFSTPSSVGTWSTPSKYTDFDYSTPSFLDNDWAGLDLESAPTASSSSSSSTATPARSALSSSLTLSGGGLDLGPAPRGPSASGWPWMYACDMIAGFKAMEALRRTGLKIPVAFTHAFRGHEYHSSTFNDNQAIYNAARAVPGELERWRDLGRQASGKWSEFRRQWRSKRS